jgi:hypothetical protein
MNEYNYWEATSPLRKAINEVGTVALAKGNSIPLFKALEMVGMPVGMPYSNPELYAKAVALATASVLALKA